MNTIPQHLLHPTFWSALTSDTELLALLCYLAFLSALSFVAFMITAQMKKNRECLCFFLISIMSLVSSISGALWVHEERSSNVLSQDPEAFIELAHTIITNDCETQAAQLRFALNANPGYLSNAAFDYIQDGAQQCALENTKAIITGRSEPENDASNPDLAYLARFAEKLQFDGRK